MSASSASPAPARRFDIVLAFAIVYLVWGSTYLAIRIGVADAPPLLFAGLRFLIAGPLLIVYARWRGAAWPVSWRDGWLIGVTALMMLVAGNGSVTVAEQWVASNQAALIVATSALWMAGFGALGARGERLGAISLGGLLLGFAGVVLLVGEGLRQNLAPLFAYLLLTTSPLFWAAGAILLRRHPPQVAPLMAAALQMLVTGVVMTGAGLALGEHHHWRWTPAVAGSLLYLAIFGSCIAYGAFYWLVHTVTPAQLGTYAYVNPAIAVLLGAWLLDERLSAMQLAGTGVILGSVIIVTLAQRARAPR